MAESISLEQIYTNHVGKVSDKWLSYFQSYERIFAPWRDGELSLLEIGVQNGGSLEIWGKYFKQAQAIVGCDINAKSGELQFDDERISVVVGDATQRETRLAILDRCSAFDIIIDDGSHNSTDIVEAFLSYFFLLRDGGVFVAEDLACSYWQEYEGGLYSETSAMSFFKLLADYVNREAWGIPLDGVTFFARSGFDVTDHLDALDAVQGVEFAPSMCIVHKAQAGNAGLGPRVIAGCEFQVEDAIKDLAGQCLQAPSQVHNPASVPLSKQKSEWQPRELHAQLYRADSQDTFTEAASSSVTFVPDGEPVTLQLPVDTGEPVEKLRLDLANKPSAIILSGLSLKNKNGEDLWCWDKRQESFFNCQGLVFRNDVSGLMIVCLDHDPQFEIAIPSEVLTRAGLGSYLKVEMSGWPLLDVLPKLMEQPASFLAVAKQGEPSKMGVANPALINELSETAELFRSVVEKRNVTIAQQRDELQNQEAIKEGLRAEIQKAEAQLDILKEFVASAFGNTNDRI
ncbi:MAG: hypothetical protein AWU57_404 [Marinobacter sp. T13-3]|mgnify:CR=1 FL=1|nr:MAG: hypothetical protein AWU57_404 [Marinobacter sp. T13-3]